MPQYYWQLCLKCLRSIFLMVCDSDFFVMFISCISISTDDIFHIAVSCQILCIVSSASKSEQNYFCNCWSSVNIFFKITWVYLKKKRNIGSLHRNNKTLWKLLVYFLWCAYSWSCWKCNKSESVFFSKKQKII